jgi:hypothetical protein
MKSSISRERLQSYFEADDLERLYSAFLTIYTENTNGNELDEPIKRDLRDFLLKSPNLEAVIEKLEGLVETYQHYFHK